MVYRGLGHVLLLSLIGMYGGRGILAGAEPSPRDSSPSVNSAGASSAKAPAPPGPSAPAVPAAASAPRQASDSHATAAGASDTQVVEIPLRASDGHSFFADYYAPSPSQAAPGILLVPDMGKTRKSLSSLATALRDRGYHVLAMDNTGQMRNVVHQGALQTFKPIDSRFLASLVLDVGAAAEALQKRPQMSGRYLEIGFGIGANLALQYAGESEPVAGVALVKPGFGCDEVNPYDSVAYLQSRPAILIEMKKRQASDLSRAFHAVAMQRKDLAREQIMISRTPPAGEVDQMWPDDEIRDKVLDWVGRTLPASGN